MTLVSNQSNIIVTGGCGFLGSAFIRYLFQNTSFSGKVINLDKLTYSANTKSLSSIASSPRYVFYQVDICNTSLVAKIVQQEEISLIVHFAAETHVDRSIHDPSVFMESNIRGTFSLLEVVKAFPEIHFHQISTDEVFGSLGESGVFSEISPYRPSSPYSASKAAADHLVRSYANTYNLSTSISYSCNNYGPFQYPEKFIPVVISHLLEGKKVPLYGTGRNCRTWIFVEDHARAVWEILQKGYRGCAFCIGGEEAQNRVIIKQLVQLVCKEDSVESYINQVIDRPGHDFRYALSTKKIEKEIGFIPSVTLQEGLIKTLHWYKKRQRLSSVEIK